MRTRSSSETVDATPSSEWDYSSIVEISAALHSREISAALRGGRVEQTNFDTCQILRINEAPAVDVNMLKQA